jgi:hypothetical protein
MRRNLHHYRDYLWNVLVSHYGDPFPENSGDFYTNHWMFHADCMIYYQQNYSLMLHLLEEGLELELHSIWMAYFDYMQPQQALDHPANIAYRELMKLCKIILMLES